MPFKQSIHAMMTGFGIFILAASWTLILMVIHNDKNTEMIHIQKEMKNLSLILQRHIENTFDQIQHSLHSVRQNYEQRKNPAETAGLLSYLAQSRPDLFNLITVIDATGHVRLTSYAPLRPTYSGDRTFFLHHRKNSGRDFFMETPLLGRVTGKWYIPVSLRLEDRRGNFIGVLLASVNPGYFSKIFSELSLGKDSLIYFANEQGQILSGRASDQNLSFEWKIDSAEIRRIFLGRESEKHFEPRMGFDGIERIYGYSFLKDRQMVVAVSSGFDESLKSFYHRRLILLLAQSGFSAVMLFFLVRLIQTVLALKASGNSLRQSEKKFKKIVENLPIAIGEADFKGKILYLNPNFTRIFGYTLNEIPTVEIWSKKAYPDSRYREETTRVWFSDLQWIQEHPDQFSPIKIYRITSKFGQVLEVEISFALIEQRIYTVFHDVTGQKKAEREILELNAGLEEQVFKRTQQLQQTNENLRQSNEILTRTLYELKHTQNKLVFSEKLAALGQMVAGIAHEVNTPLGAILSMSGIMKEEVGRLPGIFDFYRTLSEEETVFFSFLLKQAITLDISKEMAMMSGKNRQNLSRSLKDRGIQNAEETAKKLLAVGFQGEAEEVAPFFGLAAASEILNSVSSFGEVVYASGIIKTAAEKILNMVSALKTYTYRHDDQEKSLIDVAEGIELVLALYYSQYKYGVEIVKNFSSRPRIPAYPDKLTQVWVNLINNAIQAMDFKGLLEISINEDPEWITVAFADNGPGIAPEIQDQIFLPFFTTKNPGEGTGLGLDMCKNILEEIAGSLDFESIPGKTVFRVKLKKA